MEMSSRNISAWSVDGKPSRWDTVAAVSALLSAILYFSIIETVSWGWLAIGFVASILAAGPVATSAIGARIGAWFETIGVAGRASAIIIAFIVWHWMVEATLGIPETPTTSFIIGGLFVYGVIVVVEAVRARVFG